MQGHRDGHGFLMRDDGDGDIFLPPNEMRAVLHKDRVKVRIVRQDRKGRPEGRVVEIIEQVFAEDDQYHGLDGMHKIRETISVEKVNVDLPPKVAEFCVELNKMVYDKQIDGEWAFGHS